MARGEQPLDWAAAEALAFATLAAEGIRVRLSGQDSGRGTFSQRHAVLHDTEDGHTYMPLQHLAPDQAPVEIFNSPLSEAGVLGFEYGYSLDYPDGLVAVGGAVRRLRQRRPGHHRPVHRQRRGQVAQSERAGAAAAARLRGQGPEHSSARLERFLTLAADDNMQIVDPDTPAQYFHCLRRQALRRWRKPLVVLTPKSLLRHPRRRVAAGRPRHGPVRARAAGPRGGSAFG